MSLDVCSLPSPTGPCNRAHDIKSQSVEATRSLEFLSSVSGDLSNVTAPPSFLAPSSVVEVGNCWSQRPGVFAAPALVPDPARRSLLVLRMILIAMRSQFYVAGSPTISIKKPLNAFLGELFLASWTHLPKMSNGTGKEKETGLSLEMESGDGKPATTRLIAEQVSHHPPITAMAIIDDEHGIRADGYARVEMTFSSSVDIRQIGHAILHIDEYDEDFLIPLPDVKVRGFLSGRLYPEVLGTYTIVSSSGYVSEMSFSGAGVFRGKKNAFEVKMYRKDDPKKTPIYEVSGVWSEGWTVKDSRTGEILEKYDVDAVDNRPAPMDIDPIDEQDPWESRRAWGGVIDALNRGDFRETVAEKSRLEQAQRQMRVKEKRNGETWEPLLFARKDGDKHKVFHQLAEGTSWRLFDEKTKGGVRVIRIGLLAFTTALLICYHPFTLSRATWGWRPEESKSNAVDFTVQDEQSGPKGSTAETKWPTSPAEAVYSDSTDGSLPQQPNSDMTASSSDSNIAIPPIDGSSSQDSGSDAPGSSSSGFNEEKYDFQKDLLLYTQPAFDVAKLKQYRPHNDHGPGQFAFATYLSTRDNSVHDPYFLSAMQLVYRVLWDPNSRSPFHPIVVFVAPFIPQEQRDLLRAAGAIVRELDLLDFARFAFLDLDAFPVKPLDGIFDESVAPRQRCEAELLPPEDKLHEQEICDYIFAGHGLYDGVNVGVMVLEPNHYMHQRLLRESQDTTKFDNKMAEQAFLNYAFGKDGPFPPNYIGREWNGFYPKTEEESVLRIVHEKLWVSGELTDWTKDIFMNGWFELLTLYQSSEFEQMRAEDGLLEQPSSGWSWKG
ncbi:hypothetical protein VMCG_07730 [Cytospora schulzeri]|uniref:Uncharacterized protein n=1 Tax=Cytospora schulzeri TaxID=448051 RepID=A0A423VYY5_9PEZI|nr:hypothetical protein VMCG_07730 [Valsa malicola]